MDEDKEFLEKFANMPLNAQTFRELAKAVVLKNGKNLTKEQKIETAKVLIKTFEEGKDPRELMGISDKEMANMYSYGFSLFNAGKFEEAKCMFYYMLAIAPFNPIFSNCLGMCYHKLKDYQNAAKYYYQSAFIDVDNPLPYFYAYDCFDKLNDPVSCMEVLGLVLSRAKKDVRYKPIEEKARALVEAVYKQHPDLFVRLNTKEAK